MKKITFMLSLLMSMGAMTTSAQVLSRTGWIVTTSGECDDNTSGHAAAIIDGKNDTYWHSNWGGNNASGDATNTLPQFFQLDLGSEQEFQTIGYMPRPGIGDNGVVKGFSLYVSDSQFETVSSSKTAAQVVNGLGTPAMTGTFSYDGETSASLKTATASSILKGRYVLFVVTDAVSTQINETDPSKSKYFASCAEFYLAKGSTIESKTVTYHYKVDGVEYATRSVQCVDVTTANVPTIDYLTNGTITDNADGSKDVACTTAYPFVAQATFDANTAHWYSMAVRAGSGNYLLAAKDNGKVGTITKELLGCPEGIGNEMQWAFVGNLKDGFTLYNKANNKQIVVKQVTETNSDGTKTNYTQFDLAENDGAALKLRKDNNGFGLYATEGNCFNRFDENRIAEWSGFDDGSTFRIQEPNDYVLNYAAQYSLYDDNGAPEGAIGANSYLSVAENLNAFKAAYAAAKAGATTETLNALAAQNNKVEDGLGETIQAGKYYRLVNAASKKTLYLDASGVMKSADNVSKSATSVVKFDNAEAGRFRMKLEGKTFGKRVGNNQAITLEADNSGNKGSYKVVQVGTHFAFYDMVSNVSDRSYLHCNAGADAANTLFGWDAGGINSPSRWFVIPATDVEIDMTAQGDKKYASAYLPFGVSNVAGATAYTGALNAEKNTIDMTATTSVPANTGFVLVGTEDKATLTIGEAAAIEGNALIGTNTGIAFAEATPKANYLVFGVNADKVGFYTPGNVTAIPANKAYINASALGASAIALNFGNTVTGINAATINNGENNAPIYDLSGRRVWAPVKGGLYIQNGKKLVK